MSDAPEFNPIGSGVPVGLSQRHLAKERQGCPLGFLPMILKCRLRRVATVLAVAGIAAVVALGHDAFASEFKVGTINRGRGQRRGMRKLPPVILPSRTALRRRLSDCRHRKATPK